MFNIRKMQEQTIINAIKAASDNATAEKIVFGTCTGAASENNAQWVSNMMKRLESHFPAPVVKQIRMNCQCGYGMEERLQLVKELIAASSSLEEFGNLEKARAAGLFYADNELYLQFNFCPCPVVAEVDKFDSLTWCQCTAGYSKVLFEKAFNCEVTVELLKSIKAGDAVCLMTIRPEKTSW
jgi:predicted hydrocarbon binding protein